MSIWIDGSHYPLVPGTVPVAPVHIESVGVTVKLDDRAGSGSAIDDFIDIDLIAFSFQQQPTRYMTDHGNVWVFHRPNNTFGLFLF